MKKELKKQHPSLAYSIIDALADLDPSETNKYLPFLIRYTRKIYDKKTSYIDEYNATKPPGINVHFENYVQFSMIHLLCREVFEEDELRTLNLFHELVLKNRIDETDITKYDSFNELQKAVDKSLMKYESKDREKGVFVIRDDEKYLIIKPLTYEASIKYGYNTKWCTAAVKSDNHFNRYTKSGILIYLYDKKTFNKLAIHADVDYCYRIKEISFWNAEDTKIDSCESGFDGEILKELLTDIRNDKRSNYIISLSLGFPTREEDECKSCTNEVAEPHPELITEDATAEQYGVDHLFDEPLKKEKKPHSKFKKIINKIRNLFTTRKHILVMIYDTQLNDRNANQLANNFRESNMGKKYDMIMFPHFWSVDFNEINRTGTNE